ncbi:MAG: carboxypeptidase regulatory-like domain-containing protein [Longimicrobiales bacterium]|nr:carboxypeptidase regulatory-like domain-containing protein [Longimicrobiales bacterium]
MRISLAATVWIALWTIGTSAIGAQQGEPAPTALLTGTVFDSLTGQALAGAEVHLGEGLGTAATDELGRFTLRAAAGEYVLWFSHRDVSPWPALHHRMAIRLEAGRTVSVTLATASAATVLDRTCGPDGAVAGGTVRDLLTLAPLAAASVDVEARRGEGPAVGTLGAAADGSWFVCLRDPEAELEVRARLGEDRSRAVRVAGSGAVRTEDLYVPSSRPTELRGLVLDGESGVPLGGAAVEVMGTRLRTVTGEDGRFLFRGVPPGAIRLAVRRLGYGLRERVVRSEGGTTARVTLELFPEAIAVDSVVVTVEGGVVDRDRLATRFDGLTRAQIDGLLHRTVDFDDLLRNANVPGLKVRDVEYRRDGGIPQRGICVETARRSSTGQGQCQMVEVYLNDVHVADAEVLLEMLDPASVDHFQLLSPTQAGIEYMGTARARNGILLIWTRRR